MSVNQFQCSECHHVTDRASHKCPACGKYKTLHTFHSRRMLHPGTEGDGPVPIAQVKGRDVARYTSGDPEMDRVLGGGIVAGAIYVMGGNPGIGKSTLLTQVAGGVGRSDTVLYFSAEEKGPTVRARASRIQAESAGFLLAAVASVEDMVRYIHHHKPALVIVDSIQAVSVEGIEGQAGQVKQVIESASRLAGVCRANNATLFLVCHNTKNNKLAGPNHLQHLVDAVLEFTGQEREKHRYLYKSKDRNASIHETGAWSMEATGLVPVPAAQENWFVGDRNVPVAGAITALSHKGKDQLVACEIQALVVGAEPGELQRMTCVGVDRARVELVLSVLRKYTPYKMRGTHITIGTVGGLTLKGSLADLAIACALVSSATDIPLSDKVAVGELGLTGEIYQREGNLGGLDPERIIAPAHQSAIAEVFEQLFE